MLVFEELWPGGPKFAQRNGVFMFSTDSVLLADFANTTKVRRCADLGCGAGVLTVLLAEKNREAFIDGVEIQAESAALCRENLKVNHLDDKVRVIEGDLREHRKLFKAGDYDLVVSNPPYFPVGRGGVSPLEERDMARSESMCSLSDICQAAAYLCRFGGSFALVHRPERLSEVFCAMTKAGIEPKRLRLVSSRAQSPPSLALIEGRRGGKPGLAVEPLLIMHDDNGDYTQEMKRIYHLL
ncbi:MAG: tRNA1(Val) (adenine(37)-N6)-methyltransferase [Oscillospiraceae bacterium]|jgi:tRNA1Val (adenine37-N6)-methyltransferase